MRQVTSPLLLVWLLVAAPVGLLAQDGFELGKDEAAAATRQQLVYAKKEDAPANLQRLIGERLAKLPEGYKIQIINDMVYSNHPDNPGLIPMLNSIVPLNPKDQPDGVEEFHRHWGGGLSRTVTWKEGKRHGPEKFYERQPITNAEGRRTGEQNMVKREITWEDGHIHGVQRTFFADGSVQSETNFANGAAEGMARSFDERGRLTRETEMKGGRRHGLMKEFWQDSGRVSKEVPYRDGKVHGVVKEFYSSGQLKRELPFRDNLMHGEERQFEADGKVSRVRFWLKGDEVEAEAYAAGKDAP